jgi:hypothetical protein
MHRGIEIAGHEALKDVQPISEILMIYLLT